MQLWYVNARNQQAHETSEEFAKLLLDQRVKEALRSGVAVGRSARRCLKQIPFTK